MASTPLISTARDGTCYSSQGEGDVVLCLHGLGLDHSMWAEQVPALSAHFRVVCVDLLGHGGSPRPPEPAAMSDFANQVIALLDELSVARARIVGFDLGGQVAISAAAVHAERFEALALISTAYRRLKAQRDMMLRRAQQAERHGPAANADSAIQRWFSAAFQADNKAVVQSVRDRVAGNDPVGYLLASHAYAEADIETVDLVRDIRCPTLVMTGALDMGTTPVMARRLADAIADSKLIIVPRQRHMLPLEAPQIVNPAVLSFFGVPG